MSLSIAASVKDFIFDNLLFGSIKVEKLNDGEETEHDPLEGNSFEPVNIRPSRTSASHPLATGYSDYDLLVSAGTHVDCVLDIADLGASFSYQPGTAIAVVGKVLCHGVKCWDGGERICQDHFMKDAVHDRLGLSRPSWVNYADYIRLTYDQV